MIDPRGTRHYPWLLCHGPRPGLSSALSCVDFWCSEVSSLEGNANRCILWFSAKYCFWGSSVSSRPQIVSHGQCGLHESWVCCCGLSYCPCQGSGNCGFWCNCWRDLWRKIFICQSNTVFLLKVLCGGIHAGLSYPCCVPWWVGMCCILFRSISAGGPVGEQSVSDRDACGRVGVGNKSIIVAQNCAAVWRIWCSCGRWFVSYLSHAG